LAEATDAASGGAAVLLLRRLTALAMRRATDERALRPPDVTGVAALTTGLVAADLATIAFAAAVLPLAGAFSGALAAAPVLADDPVLALAALLSRLVAAALGAAFAARAALADVAGLVANG
jgi:hypothetical protein